MRLTDEGQQGNPMDAVELLNAVRNLAAGAWAMYEALKEEGFQEGEAIKLTASWLHGTAGGKLS